MKTKPIKLTREEPEPLDETEMECADEIARLLKDKTLSTPRGLLIYDISNSYGVDHHKIARHLGSRNKKW